MLSEQKPHPFFGGTIKTLNAWVLLAQKSLL